jgi:hypothetical protein
MDAANDALPDDIDALRAALIIARAKALEAAAELAIARAKASEDLALIAQQKLRIAKLERQVYGQRSERSARLVDQLSLTFEELEAGATEDELTAEEAVAKTTTVAGFTRKRPERNTFPDPGRLGTGLSEWELLFFTGRDHARFKFAYGHALIRPEFQSGPRRDGHDDADRG